MDQEENSLNIPAYQRKRSIEAKAKKAEKRGRKRKNSSTPAKTRITEQFIDLPTSNNLPPKEQFTDNVAATNTKIIREMSICGRIEGYYEKINVAIITVTAPFRAEDNIIIESTDGLFEQQVESMQKNNRDISLARSGYSVGIKMVKIPKIGGMVYKVV